MINCRRSVATERTAALLLATAALELRQRAPDKAIPSSALLGMLQHTPIERLLEAMAANLNDPRAADVALKIDLVFSDLGRFFALLDNAPGNFPIVTR